MSSRSIDITQINANGQNGKLLRVQSNAITFVDLYTSNVIESGNTTTGNVFFTNTRAVGALTAGQNISISANGLITGDAQPFSGNTTNVPEGANLYFTNARVWAAISGNIDSLNNTLANLTTSNIAEGTNLYYTNARVYANVISLLLANNIVETGNTTTGNVFFTNARAVGALTGGTGITIASNGLIVGTSAFSGNTNLVPEGSANLYYTNARVYANVLDLLPNYTGNLQIGNANLLGTLTLTGNIVAATTGNGYLTGANLLQTNYIRANVWEQLFASNVVESGNTLTGNVFFTNARAVAALTGGQNITIAANGMITGASQAFSGNTNLVPEGSANLYYTNARVYANVLDLLPNFLGNVQFGNANVTGTITAGNVVTGTGSGGSITGANLITTNFANVYNILQGNVIVANTWTNLFASNVIESGNTLTGNVFFTNARAVAALTGGQNITIAANGMITGASQAFSGNTNLVPEGSANLYYTNARVYANVLDLLPNYTGNLQIGNANLIGTLTLTGNIITPTSGNGYLTGANLVQTNYIRANIWEQLYASNVIESGNTLTGNVFFTNARSVAALTGGQNITIAANGMITGASQAFSGNTTNVPEGANLYFTNARAVGALTGGTGITIASNGLIVGTSAFTGNTNLVPEGSANLYYTNARVYANLVSTLPTYNGNLSVNFLSVANTLTAGNVVSGTGTGGTLSGANIISTNYANVNNILLGNVIVANVWQKLFAANVIESGNTLTGNVFFTNARAVAALTGGTGITIASNGLIVGTSAFSGNTTNVPEGANLYFTNARAVAALTGGTGITIASNGLIVGTGGYSSTDAYANLIAALPNYTGNLKAGNANILNQLIVGGNIITSGSTGGTISGANLIQTNFLVTNTLTVNGVEIVNGTSGETNVITTRITANIWNNLFASNVIESGNTLTGNVFFTNARAVAALTGGTGITIASNGLIVGTGGYSSADAYANLIAALPNYTGNLKAGNANILGTLFTGNIISATGIGGQITGANLISSNIITANTIVTGNGTGGNITGANLIVTSYIRANVWEQLFAANVIESGNTLTGNVFFTNARAVAALTGGSGITIASNGLIVGTSAFSGNTNLVPEGSANLYYTNARVYANIIGLLSANNIVETGNTLTGNVFFTNARAVAALTGGSGISIAANGLIVGTGGYSSADAYANLIAALPNYTGNLKAGNANILGTLYATNVISGTGAGGAITGANLLQTTYIRANIWENLFAANVVESGNTLTGNVFFTNARVVAALTGGTGITIASNGLIVGTSAFSGNTNLVPEGSANLYYTNARVYANVEAMLPNYTGNLKAGNANVLGTLFAGNVISGGGTGGAITGANLISAAYINANVWEKLYAANVIESGNTLTGNVFFSNARAVAALTGGQNITIAANGMITGASQAFTGNTTNVPEGANLYFTNSKAIFAVIPAVTQLTISTPVFNYNIDQYSGDNPTIYVIAGETISFNLDIGASHPFNIRVSNGGSNYDTGLTHIANDGTVSTGSSAQGKVTGKLFWKVPYSLAGSTYVYQCTNHGSMVGNIVIQRPVSTITTANVPENTNLYYSNDRVYANVISLLLANNIVETGNTTTGNVFFTNARAVAALTGGQNITIAANGMITGASQAFSGNTTNVPEGANLYYTNARVYANVEAMLPNYTGNVQFGNANITGTLYATNVISAGGIGGSITGTDTISTNIIVANTWTKLFASNVIESGNTLTGNVFFTNARAVAALTGGTGITIASNGLIISSGGYSSTDAYANLIAALPNYTGNLKAGNANVTGTIYAGNIISAGGVGGEITGANLISTTYMRANVWEKLYASNVIESGNTLTGNVYFTNARAVAALTGGTGITIASNGLIVGTSAFTGNTNLVPEGSANLYYTNARVYANVIEALPNYTGNLKAGNANVTGTIFAGNIISAGGSGGLIDGANLISTTYLRANIWEKLYAANVIESGNTLTGNVFFSNARAVAALTGGTGITIASNGLIVGTSAFTGNTNLVPEGSANLYYTNARVYANVAAMLPNYTGNVQFGNANITGTLYATNVISAGGTGGTITGTNLISTTYINANVWEKLYAANVVESGNTLTGNVFFTNARVVAALTGGTGITIAANGTITSTATATATESISSFLLMGA